MDHGARSHARYSSSGAHRVLACAGCVGLCETLPPRPDSEASEEGTAAHQALQNALLGLPNWRVGVEPDMLMAVETVLDYVENLFIARAGNRLVMEVEQYHTLPQSVVPPEDAAGIADLMLYDPVEQEAWAIEFKYGMVLVEVERNPQLLFNAAARFFETPLRRLHLVVIQPRVTYHRDGAIRTWSCGTLEIAEFQAEMDAAIMRAELATIFGPEDKLTPGEHCRYCPAEVTCPAREQGALAVAFNAPAVARQLDTFTPPDPATLGLDRIAYIRRHGDTLRSWLKAVDDYAIRLAMNGVAIPGEKLVEAQARRRWQGKPADTAAALAGISGLPAETFLPVALMDITAAEAVIVKAAREAAPSAGKNKAAQAAREKMAFLTLKSTSGNLVLVPDSDSRPTADRTAAAFAHVSIPPMEPA